jgi:osmotically-inducible protein OsmY
MTHPKQFARVLALTLALGLSGCAAFGGRCTGAACAEDAQITAEVYALLAQHAELGAPGELRVQTINRVVYLDGLVNTGLDVQIAVATAFQAAHVKDVVESIGIQGNSR